MSATAAPPTVRLLEPRDRERVEAMTRTVGLFWDWELPIALEVFDDAVGTNATRTVDPDYETAGVDLDGQLVGWAVWGPRPSEPTTFDLYWIVVDPAAQGRGIGGRLVEEMDRRVAGRASRVIVETSGRADYQPTRRFYEARGYRHVGTVPDHYAPGDDQVVFEKRY